MPASDEELNRLIRRYRLAQELIQRRAQLQVEHAWSQPNFGLSNTAWLRWAAAHPEMLALTAGDGDALLGQLQLGLKLPPQRRTIGGGPMHSDSPAWEQLKLSLDGVQLSMWAEQTRFTAEAAQYQTAVATSRFLASYSSAAQDKTIIPMGLPPATVTTEALRGVPGSELWARPLSDFRIALFEGRPVTAARTLASVRTRQLLGTNIQMAHLAASVRYMRERGDRDNIVGYMRSPRGGRSCALCLLASTQRYHRGDLMPIHDHCHCVTKPIYGDRDPGQVILPAQLNAVHARIDEATGSSDLSGGHYRDAVLVHMHGEIGPVLTYREHSFTGPSDLQDSN